MASKRKLMNWILVIVVLALVFGLYALKRISLVAADRARQMLREGAWVVDVRTPAEFNAGHLPGALNLPLGGLKEAIALRVPNKNQVLLLHCLSGARSGIAREQLKGLGYSTVFNLGSYSRAQAIVGAERPTGHAHELPGTAP